MRERERYIRLHTFAITLAFTNIHTPNHICTHTDKRSFPSHVPTPPSSLLSLLASLPTFSGGVHGRVCAPPVARRVPKCTITPVPGRRLLRGGRAVQWRGRFARRRRANHHHHTIARPHGRVEELEVLLAQLCSHASPALCVGVLDHLHEAVPAHVVEDAGGIVTVSRNGLLFQKLQRAVNFEFELHLAMPAHLRSMKLGRFREGARVCASRREVERGGESDVVVVLRPQSVKRKFFIRSGVSQGAKARAFRGRRSFGCIRPPLLPSG